MCWGLVGGEGLEGRGWWWVHSPTSDNSRCHGNAWIPGVSLDHCYSILCGCQSVSISPWCTSMRWLRESSSSVPSLQDSLEADLVMTRAREQELLEKRQTLQQAGGVVVVVAVAVVL